MEGHWNKTGKTYMDRVSVKPIAHHYEDKGEEPYIKYSCPVCDEFGARHALDFGESHCPICNVYLFWGYDI